MSDENANDSQWPIWEVFVQLKQGKPHVHVGSVHASDEEMALQNGRDTYGRRDQLISMWVVPSGAITATTRSDAGPFFDPSQSKPYLHPSFFAMPKGVKGL